MYPSAQPLDTQLSRGAPVLVFPVLLCTRDGFPELVCGHGGTDQWRGGGSQYSGESLHHACPTSPKEQSFRSGRGSFVTVFPFQEVQSGGHTSPSCRH